MPKSIEQIMEESADSCMAVLQGFILGRYGEAIVAREITDEFRLIIKEYTQSILMEAERRMPNEKQLCNMEDCPAEHKDSQEYAYNDGLYHCKQVLRNMRGV